MIKIIISSLSRYWLHFLVIGLVAYAFKYTYDSGVNSERDRWEKKAYQATITAHEVARKFTAGVLSDHQETQEDGNTKIDQLQNNVAAANTAADIVRDELEAFIQRSADDSARFASDRKAAEARYRVLADMYRESDRLAGIYAKEADERKIAGDACQKSYGDLVEWLRKTYGLK